VQLSSLPLVLACSVNRFRMRVNCYVCVKVPFLFSLRCVHKIVEARTIGAMIMTRSAYFLHVSAEQNVVRASQKPGADSDV
jgi:hypothetical protein